MSPVIATFDLSVTVIDRTDLAHDSFPMKPVGGGPEIRAYPKVLHSGSYDDVADGGGVLHITRGVLNALPSVTVVDLEPGVERLGGARTGEWRSSKCQIVRANGEFFNWRALPGLRVGGGEIVRVL